jgi:hypothetical protein
MEKKSVILFAVSGVPAYVGSVKKQFVICFITPFAFNQ